MAIIGYQFEKMLVSPIKDAKLYFSLAGDIFYRELGSTNGGLLTKYTKAGTNYTILPSTHVVAGRLVEITSSITKTVSPGQTLAFKINLVPQNVSRGEPLTSSYEVTNNQISLEVINTTVNQSQYDAYKQSFINNHNLDVIIVPIISNGGSWAIESPQGYSQAIQSDFVKYSSVMNSATNSLHLGYSRLFSNQLSSADSKLSSQSSNYVSLYHRLNSDNSASFSSYNSFMSSKDNDFLKLANSIRVSNISAYNSYSELIANDVAARNASAYDNFSQMLSTGNSVNSSYDSKFLSLTNNYNAKLTAATSSISNQLVAHGTSVNRLVTTNTSSSLSTQFSSLVTSMSRSFGTTANTIFTNIANGRVSTILSASWSSYLKQQTGQGIDTTNFSFSNATGTNLLVSSARINSLLNVYGSNSNVTVSTAISGNGITTSNLSVMGGFENKGVTTLTGPAYINYVADTFKVVGRGEVYRETGFGAVMETTDVSTVINSNSVLTYGLSANMVSASLVKGSRAIFESGFFSYGGISTANISSLILHSHINYTGNVTNWTASQTYNYNNYSFDIYYKSLGKSMHVISVSGKFRGTPDYQTIYGLPLISGLNHKFALMSDGSYAFKDLAIYKHGQYDAYQIKWPDLGNSYLSLNGTAVFVG